MYLLVLLLFNEKIQKNPVTNVEVKKQEFLD
jgi:hypothetical protein